MIKSMHISQVLMIALFLMGCKNQRQPNIILIMADDLGYGEIGVMGMKRSRHPTWTDLSPVLFNKGKLKNRNVFWRYRGSSAMRNGSMKLLTSP